MLKQYVLLLRQMELYNDAAKMGKVIGSFFWMEFRIITIKEYQFFIFDTESHLDMS